MGFPGGSAIKNLPAMQEPQKMQVWSLGREDPLEEEMAMHSSILAWRIPRTEEPGRLQSVGLQSGRHNWSDLACMHAHIYVELNHFALYLKQTQYNSLVAQTVKRLPAMQETWVWSLGQEDSPGEGNGNNSSTLAWKIPWLEEPSSL